MSVVLKKIPKDLAWIAERQRMKATGILSLMRLAKQAKQRLSDVVAATRKYLEALKGRDLYAYLKALLSKDCDYSRRASETAKAEQTQHDREYIDRKTQELSGRVFMSRNRAVLVEIRPDGLYDELRNGRRACGKIGMELIEAIQARHLLPVESFGRMDIDE